MSANAIQPEIGRRRGVTLRPYRSTRCRRRAPSQGPRCELPGATFTLNNYGSFGVDGSAAILGVGRAIERPWVVDGAIAPRRILQVSLVFDHRVCDGGYAAGFLRTVVEAIEHPARLFALV